MTAEVSFTKRAAAELSRRFNGLTVRSRGSSSSSASPSANPPVQPTSKGGQLTGWVVEGVRRQQQRGNQNKRYERISEYLTTRYRTLEELWLDPSFLATLFFYVSPSDRGIMAQVCKTWRDVLYQPVFWTGVMPVLRCRELRAISGDLSSTSELRKRVYSSLAKRGFTSLCLFGASDDDVFDVVSNFPGGYARTVRWLALRCCNATDKGHEVLLEFFGEVVRLEMSGCNEVTDAGLWASLHPRIVHLTLADCINIADESVAAIAQLLPNLRELNLQAYHVTDAALSFFGPQQGGTLQALRLRSCWELTNHGLLNLVHVLPNLTVLSLSGCSKITDDGVELLAENLRQLRVLDLSWCPRISDAALEYIACDLSLLEELTLDRCVHVTDIGVGYLSTMVSLRILYLRWCSQIRDFGLQHLCSMRNLQVLSLAGCPLLTSNGLSSLVQLRDLRELELTNCAGASEELFEYLHVHLPMCLVIEWRVNTPSHRKPTRTLNLTPFSGGRGIAHLWLWLFTAERKWERCKTISQCFCSLNCPQAWNFANSQSELVQHFGKGFHIATCFSAPRNRSLIIYLYNIMKTSTIIFTKFTRENEIWNTSRTLKSKTVKINIYSSRKWEIFLRLHTELPSITLKLWKLHIRINNIQKERKKQPNSNLSTFRDDLRNEIFLFTSF